MKHLVKWQITRTEPAPCPDYRPDPYTGEYPLVSCAVLHTTTTVQNMVRCFYSREEADRFIADCPKPTIRFTVEPFDDTAVDMP